MMISAVVMMIDIHRLQCIAIARARAAGVVYNSGSTLVDLVDTKSTASRVVRIYISEKQTNKKKNCKLIC